MVPAHPKAAWVSPHSQCLSSGFPFKDDQYQHGEQVTSHSCWLHRWFRCWVYTKHCQVVSSLFHFASNDCLKISKEANMAHGDQLTMTFLAVWMESLPWFHDFIKWTWWRYRSNCFERTPWSFQPFWRFKTNRTSINNNKQLHGKEDHHHHDYTQQFSSHRQGEQKASTIETTSLSRKQPSPPQFVVQLLHSSLRWV